MHLDGASRRAARRRSRCCASASSRRLAPLLSRRLGIARTIALAARDDHRRPASLRVAGGVALLFTGTMLAAAGAACGNVLLPVIVRRSFPERIGRISALYTTSLVGVAALAAGVDGAARPR